MDFLLIAPRKWELRTQPCFIRFQDTHLTLISFVLKFQAYNKGKTFKGRALKVSWYRPSLTPSSPATAVGPTTPTTPTVLKKVEEELGLDIDAELVRTE